MSLTSIERLRAKMLNQQHGGNWKFNSQAGWWEDDRGRMIMVVDYIFDITRGVKAPVCYMYGDGAPRLVPNIE